MGPFKRSARIPSIIQIMLRTMEVGSVSRRQALSKSADLYLRPPLQGVKPTDFAEAGEIASLGYRSAKDAVAGWLENPEIPAERKPLVRQKGKP